MKDRSTLLLPLLAIVLVGPKPAKAQDAAPDRKVRIEVSTTENGETTTVTHELDGTDQQAIENALRELGVLDDLSIGTDGENLSIDIRRWRNGEAEKTLEHALRLIPHDAGRVHGKRGHLGVSTAPLTEEARKSTKTSAKAGALVVEVIKDSPAEKAGLQEDDVIIAVDGRAITGPKELTEAIRAHEPNATVKIDWQRGTKKQSANVTLGERKAMAYAYRYGPQDFDAAAWKERASTPYAFLGVTPGDGEGAMVGGVEEGSAAERMGIQKGDVIRSVNGKAVADFGELRETIAAMKPGEDAEIEVLRGTAILKMQGTLGEHKGGMRLRRLGGEDGHFREFHFDGFGPTERGQLREEMDRLREELEQLRDDPGNGIRREVRVLIESRELTADEKELLRKKGVSGLDNELELDDLSVFPNPGNGHFRLRFEVPERGDLQVLVHDATGERVYEERITGFKGRYERTLDLSDKASGSYFIVVQQGGRSATRKIIKQ